MSVHRHELHGCAPVPLASYLKALGILRLVTGQSDASARAFWDGEGFVLLTRLDRDALEAFFLHDYAPTPWIAPWNKDSGFFGAKGTALEAIENSTASRFELFRESIAEARSLLRPLTEVHETLEALKGKKDAESKRLKTEAEKHFKALKAVLLPECRRRWRGLLAEWLSAAVAPVDGERTVKPSLLGTGGNDGRLDFTSKGMERLGDLFDLADPAGAPRPDAHRWLAASLWGERTAGLLSGAKVGQFAPGGAGGANSTTGPNGDSLLDPWDFVLLLEGVGLFTAHVTKRMCATGSVEASAPFVVRSQAVSYASASEVDENNHRGEQWMPLWDRPLSLCELRHLLGEGRAQTGRRSASGPIDFARAVSRLGVARGLRGFQRFAYLERNGKSNLAVPLGRITVREHPRARLIDDIASWIERLRREARKKQASAQFKVVTKRLDDAIFDTLTHDDDTARWQAILLRMADVEELQKHSTGHRAGPIPPLSPSWVEAIDDATSNVRLALALAGASATSDSRRRADSVRHHFLPLRRDGRTFAQRDGRLEHDVRVVAGCRDPIADAIAVLTRRLVEASRAASRHPDLCPAPGTGASPSDLARLTRGDVDLWRTASLARALMALDWSRWRRAPRREGVAAGDWPEDAWILLRLACLAVPLDSERDIAVDPVVVRRLAVGDAGLAAEIARRRLSAAGLRPGLYGVAASPEQARLWAATMVFPIDVPCAHALAGRIDPSCKEMTHVG